jgi:hypothetical protein
VRRSPPLSYFFAETRTQIERHQRFAFAGVAFEHGEGAEPEAFYRSCAAKVLASFRKK